MGLWDKILSFWWLLVLFPIFFGMYSYFQMTYPNYFIMLITALLFWIGIILGFIRAKRKGYSLWSCFALLFAMFGGLLGIVFGIVALYKIRKNPELKGKGLAITAIVIAIPVIAYFTIFSVLDPLNFLPPEYQLYYYCDEICSDEPRFNTSYIEINPENSSEHICSCLDRNSAFLSQYVIALNDEDS